MFANSLKSSSVAKLNRERQKGMMEAPPSRGRGATGAPRSYWVRATPYSSACGPRGRVAARDARGVVCYREHAIIAS